MNVVYKYRIYPDKEQENLLNSWLEECTFLWNQCIIYKESKYNEHVKIYPNKETRPKMPKIDLLKELIQTYSPHRKIQLFAQSRNEVIYRLEDSYKAFFKGIRKKPKLYKPNESFESIDFPTIRNKKLDGNFDFRFKFKDYKHEKMNIKELDFSQVKYIYFPSLESDIRIVLHRDFDINTLTSIRIKKESTINEWYACFTVEKKFNSVHPSDNILGVDKGLTDLVSFSNDVPQQDFVQKSH